MQNQRQPIGVDVLGAILRETDLNELRCLAIQGYFPEIQQRVLENVRGGNNPYDGFSPDDLAALRLLKQE
jgi:hypothetical protein